MDGLYCVDCWTGNCDHLLSEGGHFYVAKFTRDGDTLCEDCVKER